MADIAMKCLHSFTFLEVNKCEYCEDQTTSNPQRTDNYMHNNLKKDDR